MKIKIQLPDMCSKFSCKNKLQQNNKKEDYVEITNIEGVYYFCSLECRLKAFEDLSKNPYKKQ